VVHAWFPAATAIAMPYECDLQDCSLEALVRLIAHQAQGKAVRLLPPARPVLKHRRQVLNLGFLLSAFFFGAFLVQWYMLTLYGRPLTLRERCFVHTLASLNIVYFGLLVASSFSAIRALGTGLAHQVVPISAIVRQYMAVVMSVATARCTRL
jgi:hypothetical protein